MGTESTGRYTIIRNSAKCLKCGDEVVSQHRHDCATCSCGNISVDGGTSYLRRAFLSDAFEDTSITEGDTGA